MSKRDLRGGTVKGSARRGRASKRAGAGSKNVVLREHPRARRQIGLAKSYAGLASFALAGWAAWHGGLPFVDVALRALLWGTAGYLVVWALAVYVWRHVAVAEVRAAERRWRESRAEEEQIRKLTKVLDDNGMPTTGV
jgi:hypothetical protein